MKTVKPFSNQSRSDATVAVEALAHAGFARLVFGDRNSVAGAPAANACGYPAVFAVSWSDPNSGGAVLMNDEQRPLGFEFDYVLVGDGLRAQWVHNNKVGFAKNQFWSHPKQAGQNCENNGYREINESKLVIGRVKNQLTNENDVNRQRNNRPSEITARSKSFIVMHASIIAGKPVVGEGK